MTTPAEELRTAATKLRAAPTDPAKASLDMCGHAAVLIGDESIGGCPDCGTRAEIDTQELAVLLVGLLNARAPLAALFDHYATKYERLGEAYEEPATGPSDRLAEGKPRLHVDFALAVARAILGGAQ